MAHVTGAWPGPLPDFLQQPGAQGVVPVVTPTGDKLWLVCHHGLARQVLADKRFSRAEAVKPYAPKANDAQPAPDSMMSMDGTDHTRLRRVVTGAFSTGRVEGMAPYIEQLTDRHLDTVAALGPGCDLISELANPLPLQVLCSLLGVPPEDSHQFRDWVEVLFDISASTPQVKARRRLELAAYMADLIAHKRRQPADDLLTSMIGAHDRGELSMAELLTLGLTLLMAGYETTVGQIGLSVLHLLTQPGAYEELRDRPDRLAPRGRGTPASHPGHPAQLHTRRHRGRTAR